MTLAGNTAGVLAQVSSGTLTLAGGNNITLSQAGNAVTISGVGDRRADGADAKHRQRDALREHGGGARAHLLGDDDAAGGNNITLSQAGNAVTVSAASQTVQTQSRFNVTLSGNTAGALAQVSSGTLTLAGGNNITLSQAGNAITISAANETQTAPPIATAVKGVSSIGSTGTLTRFAPEDHQHAGVFSAGVSTGGNTIGNTAVLPGQLVLAGGTNITLSMATAAGNLMTVSVVGGHGDGRRPVHRDLGGECRLGELGGHRDAVRRRGPPTRGALPDQRRREHGGKHDSGRGLAHDRGGQ